MIRACVDTNVLVSGLISSSGAPHAILEAWRSREFILVTSPGILRETETVLNYPRIKTKYQLKQRHIEDFLSLLRKYSVTVPGRLVPDVIVEDPQDNMVLACASEGEVHYIVSGDQHLRKLRSYLGIRIVPPAEFVEILDRSEDDL